MTRDELIHLLHTTMHTVLRESVGMELTKLYVQLANAAAEWRATGGPVNAMQETLNALAECSSDDLQTLERAYDLALLLDDIALPLLQPMRSPQGQTNSLREKLRHTTQAYSEADLRPLPKRRYPPYPQLQIAFDPLRNKTRLGQHKHACASRLADAIQRFTTLAPDTLEMDELTLEVQSSIWMLWQTHDNQEQAEGAELTDLSLSQGDWTEQNKRDELIAANDAYADALGIDPRFANFIPFVMLLHTTPLSDAKGFLEDFRHAGSQSLRPISRALRRLMHECSQHAGFTVFPQRIQALAQRVCPEELTKQDPHGSPLSQALLGIIKRVDATATKLSNSQEDFSADPVKPYVHPAGLVLDLKQLHKAISEIPGGFALAPRVRSILMCAGAYGMHGNAHEVTSEASAFSSALSELGMRSGLLEQPLDSFSEQGRAQAAGTLVSSMGRLITLLPEGEGWQGVSQPTRDLVDALLAIRASYAGFGGECVPRLILAGVSDSSDLMIALTTLHLVDALADKREGKRSTSARLVRNLSLAPELSLTLSPQEALRLLERARALKPYGEYLDARGSHQEIALSPLPRSSIFNEAILRERFVRELVRDAKASGIILTFALPLITRSGGISGSAELEQRASAGFASLAKDSITQHLRLQAGARSRTRSAAIPPVIAAASADALLGLTDALYRHPETELESAQLERYREVIEALRVAEQVHQQELTQRLKQSFPDHPQARALTALVRDWYGTGCALNDLLDGKLKLAGLPKDRASRVAGLSEAIRVWPLFRFVVRAARDAMREYSLPFLSRYASKHFPAGGYSEAFPAIESAWRSTAAALDELAQEDALSSPARSSLSRADALKLVQLESRARS